MRTWLGVAAITLASTWTAQAAPLSSLQIIASLDALQSSGAIVSTTNRAALSKALLAGQLDNLPQINVDVEFELDSDAVLPESYREVGEIADALHHPLLLGDRFLIVGHTDSTGTAEHNLVLSQKRAAAILSMLVTTFRIQPGRLEAIGVGEEQPRDVLHPDAPINRRVQIITIGPYNK